MRRSLPRIIVIALALALLAPASALAHTSRATFDWHIGDALLQSFGFPAGDQAMADNGDVVTIEGTGSFSADGKWATGGGTFSHDVVATGDTLTGTWTADSLISFQFYGCGGEGFPDDFCGGLVKLAVTIAPDDFPGVEFPGTLWLYCLLGPNIPSGVDEGVRLNVKDFINFNKPVHESGVTLFLLQD